MLMQVASHNWVRHSGVCNYNVKNNIVNLAGRGILYTTKRFRLISITTHMIENIHEAITDRAQASLTCCIIV